MMQLCNILETTPYQFKILFVSCFCIPIQSFIHIKIKIMEMPKFLLGDNTDFPEDIFILHMEYPRFIINLKNDELELLEDVDDELSDAELQNEITSLAEQAVEFYDREMKRYEE